MRPVAAIVALALTGLVLFVGVGLSCFGPTVAPDITKQEQRKVEVSSPIPIAPKR